MKGMVFTMLSEMVEEQLGVDTWDELIHTTNPASEGIYVSTDLYPDEELVAYVGALSEKLSVPAQQLVHGFGEYMLGQFAQIHPGFFNGHDLKSFLKSVHDVIHVEVRKIHPDAVLPHFDYEDTEINSLTMLYRSPRGLCALAEGLIDGAARYFNQTVAIEHPVCMHNDASHCRLHLRFSN